MRDLALANAIVWSGEELEACDAGMIYIVCDRCGYNRFEIGGNCKFGTHITTHASYIAKCINCGAVYDVNICKVRLR